MLVPLFVGMDLARWTVKIRSLLFRQIIAIICRKLCKKNEVLRTFPRTFQTLFWFLTETNLLEDLLSNDCRELTKRKEPVSEARVRYWEILAILWILLRSCLPELGLGEQCNNGINRQ